MAGRAYDHGRVKRLALVLFLLVACGGSRQVVMPDGQLWWEIPCRERADCMVEAAKICARGFDEYPQRSPNQVTIRCNDDKNPYPRR